MATKSIAWNTGSGNITLTYQGQGDGTISIQSDANNGGARSQVITVETVGGAITRNFTVSQAACPFPVGDVKNFSYTGSYQEVELPAGQYKLQCWGAQGGSNGTNSTYGITTQAGGKGGYSEGVITLSQKTIVRVYVGGAGTSSVGGFNGGGSTTGTSQYNASNEFGYSKMGGGGGATDIRLSDGALLSRMIVAGGGAGGAMCYKAVTTTTTSWTSWGSISGGLSDGDGSTYTTYIDPRVNRGLTKGKTYRVSSLSSSMPNVVKNSDLSSIIFIARKSDGTYIGREIYVGLNQSFTLSNASDIGFYGVTVKYGVNNWASACTVTITIQEKTTSSSTTTSNESQVGGVGGGTQGGGYSTTYVGKQASAGTNGSFGQGANQTTTGYRYCSGAGGGGWYGGGGGQKSDSTMTYCKYSGGGSGFVNTAASAGNRPSGYTGIQLDSGETKAGNTSFPSTSGGTETGHSGNGYAKITRLA